MKIKSIVTDSSDIIESVEALPYIPGYFLRLDRITRPGFIGPWDLAIGYGRRGNSYSLGLFDEIPSEAVILKAVELYREVGWHEAAAIIRADAQGEYGSHKSANMQ